MIDGISLGRKAYPIRLSAAQAPASYKSTIPTYYRRKYIPSKWSTAESQAKDVESAGLGRSVVIRLSRPVHNAPGPSGTAPDTGTSYH